MSTRYFPLILTVLASLFVSCSDRYSLRSGSSKLEIIPDAGGYSLNVYSGKVLVSKTLSPVIITVKDAADTSAESLGKSYSSGYTDVKGTGKELTGIARVVTEGGSEFIVEDRWSKAGDGTFIIDRKVGIGKTAACDKGFSSNLSLMMAEEEGSAGFDFFIPSVIYRDTTNMAANSVASDLGVEKLYIKETRTGTPMAMVHNKKSGKTLALLHYRPELSIGDNPGGALPGEINDVFQYGSLKLELNPRTGIGFNWPSLEGPKSYTEYPFHIKYDKDVWVPVWHGVATGFSHSYRVAVIPGVYDSYQQASVSSYLAAWHLQTPSIAPMDIDKVYENHIDLFKSRYCEWGTGDFKCAGVPGSPLTPVKGKYYAPQACLEMGFAGEQLPLGYHLYRYGFSKGDTLALRMGRSIVDFWTSEPEAGGFFPYSEWWAVNDETGGHPHNRRPSFLRCTVDGMEGLLDACRAADAYGDPQPHWKATLERIASNLVSKQNQDGSFNRAYRQDGKVVGPEDASLYLNSRYSSPGNLKGESRINTPVAVRFLVKMYEYTGDEKYRESAVKAAEYSYNEIYMKSAKFTGGTIDNPNTVDKEASMYALYAFNAANELTGDKKYLDAAEYAAINAISWVITYDFKVPSSYNRVDSLLNPYVNGGITGQSHVSTGSSATDNCIAYVPYEYFKLYVKTGNTLYRDMSTFLLHNTKLSSDYDGRMGFGNPALQSEAVTTCDFRFHSYVGNNWLSWVGMANIIPMADLENAFGKKDPSQIDMPLSALRKRLSEYGTGGGPMDK